MSALVLLVMFGFTVIIYILYNKKFLRTELFVDEDYNFDEVYLKEWYEKYRHPIEDVYSADHPDRINTYSNTEEIELKSRQKHMDEEFNKLNISSR